VLLGRGLKSASLDDTSAGRRTPDAGRRTPDIFRLGRIIRYLAVLLGCILPEASRQMYFVPQAVESVRYSNFLGSRGHY